MEQKTKREEATERQPREKGAVIIEATLSLTIFMFAIFTLLSVIQIAYVQSRMSVALCCATKELAQYSHVYYVTQMDTALASSGGKSSKVFNDVAQFLQEIGGHLGTIDDELGQFVTATGDAIEGDSLGQMFTSGAGEMIVRKLMEKNLVSGTGEDASEFLHRHRVENLSLAESKVLEGGTKDLFMRATYDIRVIRLLNIDITYHMSTWAYTTAWGE